MPRVKWRTMAKWANNIANAYPYFSRSSGQNGSTANRIPTTKAEEKKRWNKIWKPKGSKTVNYREQNIFFCRFSLNIFPWIETTSTGAHSTTIIRNKYLSIYLLFLIPPLSVWFSALTEAILANSRIMC